MNKSEAKRFFGNQAVYQVTKTEMAQAVAACLFDPVIVRKGKEGLFEDPYYKSIFRSRSISFYLSKYWLMREVQYAARRHPNRAYAKWLVLNFAWEFMSKHIDSRNYERRFRYACEQEYEHVLSPLNKVLVYIFRAALKYYQINKGTGEEAKDISSFFQLTKLHDKFKGFWTSKKNAYRQRVNKALAKFIAALNEPTPWA